MRSALPEIDSTSYGFSASGSYATPILETGEIAPPDRAEREEASTARPRRKPAWWLLYAMLPLTALVFGVADVVPATSGWRSVSELLGTLIVFLGIGLWLRANRIAMMQTDCE